MIIVNCNLYVCPSHLTALRADNIVFGFIHIQVGRYTAGDT